MKWDDFLMGVDNDAAVAWIRRCPPRIGEGVGGGSRR